MQLFDTETATELFLVPAADAFGPVSARSERTQAVLAYTTMPDPATIIPYRRTIILADNPAPVLAHLYRVMPEYIKYGNLWIAKLPQFRIGQATYIYSREDLDIHLIHHACGLATLGTPLSTYSGHALHQLCFAIQTDAPLISFALADATCTLIAPAVVIRLSTLAGLPAALRSIGEQSLTISTYNALSDIPGPALAYSTLQPHRRIITPVTLSDAFLANHREEKNAK